MSDILLCICAFIHSSVDGHAVCFHVLAIVNIASVNIGCFLKICEFLLPALLHLFVGFTTLMTYFLRISARSWNCLFTVRMLMSFNVDVQLVYKVKLMFLHFNHDSSAVPTLLFLRKAVYVFGHILVITMSQYLNNPNSTFEIFKKFYDVIHFQLIYSIAGLKIPACLLLLSNFFWVFSRSTHFILCFYSMLLSITYLVKGYLELKAPDYY